MDWTQQLDNFCERLGPGLMGEPLNAITNIAFFVAALIAFQKVKGDRGAVFLSFSIALIGVGATLFHTFATQWAALVDSLSILLFIMVYLYIATRRILGKDKAITLLAVLLFLPYAIIMERYIESALGSLNGSIQYIPVLLLIFIYGFLAKDRHTRRGLWIGGALFAIALIVRSMDQSACASLSIGTHFLWHIITAVMLTWMVIVLHRSDPNQTRSGVELR